MKNSNACLLASSIGFLIGQVTGIAMESAILFALFAIVFAIREHSEGVALKELQKQLNSQLDEPR